MKYIITNRQSSLLKEGAADFFIHMIKSRGLIQAAKLTGGYDDLIKITKGYDLTDEDKIVTIKDVLRDEPDGISIYEQEGEPIYFFEEDDELHQIEFINMSGAGVVVVETEEFEELDDYIEPYEDLPEDILDEIFGFIMKHYGRL